MESILYENKGTTDLVFELERLISCAVEEGLNNNLVTGNSLGFMVWEYTVIVGGNVIKLLNDSGLITRPYELFINGVRVDGAVSKDFLDYTSKKIIDSYRSRTKEEKTRQTCLEVLNSWK